MIPVEQAFANQSQHLLEHLDPYVAQGLLAHAHRFARRCMPSSRRRTPSAAWSGMAR
jgi:hypothetical protein